MGVTRLKRKARRNKQTSAKRNARIKSLSFQPVIKNVDAEELKASFVAEEAPKKKAAKAKKVEKAEEPKVEEVAEVVEEPKAEATEEAKDAE